MRKLVQVSKYDLRDRKSVRYHDVGKYLVHPEDKGDYRPWDPDHKNRGTYYTKCGQIISINPFGINGAVTLEYYLTIRRDHADKFAKPCGNCFKSLVEEKKQRYKNKRSQYNH